eukprot:gene19623-25533_t
MNRIITKIPLKSIRKFSSLPSYVLNTPLTELTTTSNGIRVASETYHGETATVGVWIDAGSRYETDANNGVAHFLEHLSFKGTANRTQQQLEIEIENMGGHLNAYTSREQTVYYAKVFKNDVPKAIEILSDILQNSLLTEKSIEIERDVILREAEEVGKQYEETILDHLHETAFLNTGLGRTILGSEHNIKNIKRSDIEAHVALAFQGASWTSEYAFPLMLIQTILGSWDRTSAVGKNSASKLARDIAEGEFAHSFVTFNTCYKDTGLFGVYLVAPDNKLDDLLWYTMDNLVRLCHEVTDEEVERAKVQLKANLLTQLDNFSSITEDIGRQILTYGRRVSTAETFIMP